MKKRLTVTINDLKKASYMPYKVITNELIPISDWYRFFQNNLFRSPFQSPDAYTFFSKIDTIETDVHAVINEDGDIKALTLVITQKENGIKGFFSKRGILYGGPLLDDIDAAKELLHYVTNFYRGKVIYLESRNYFNYERFANVYKQLKWEYIPWLNFHLKTDDVKSVHKRMSSGRLRQVKKGIKNGAIWEEPRGKEDVESFYYILKNLYNKIIKKPLPDLNFFLKFYNVGLGKYFLIYFEGEVIGGIMCPILDNKSIYEWYICGKDKEYKDQYPSVLATYAAIDYGLRNNISYFDFMGAGPVSDSYGVRQFKARFGGDQVEYGRYRIILNHTLFAIGKTGLQLLARLK